METVLANYSASITELQNSPIELLKKAEGEAVAIVDNNTPSAYLVPSELYHKMMDIIDDYYLLQEAEEALKNKEDTIEVTIDQL